MRFKVGDEIIYNENLKNIGETRVKYYVITRITDTSIICDIHRLNMKDTEYRRNNTHWTSVPLRDARKYMTLDEMYHNYPEYFL